MHSKLLAVAVATGLGLSSFSAAAAQGGNVTLSSAQLEQMKAQIAALQAQVNELEKRTDAQSDINVSQAKTVEALQQNQVKLADAKPASLDKLSYKGVNITLGGFLAAESIYRSHNQGADVASNWNGIPYKNVSSGHTREFRMSERQSRFSLLAQGDVSDTIHLAGYYELDFLGGAQTANQNESNSFNPRTRNVYLTIDWDNPGLHLLAGQNWSLLTLNSKGITPRNEAAPPFIDAQYMPGFTWARQAQVRLVKDWNKTWWLGLSLENPQTTYYNSPNASKAPVQSVYNMNAGSGYDSANTLSLNHTPDVVAKLAVDPGWGHYEIFALGRAFYNRYLGSNHNVYGGGFGVGMLLPLVPKMLDFQFSGMTGRGIGRYGSAQMPDVTFKPNGELAPIKESMLLAGLTWHPNADLDIYGYAGREKQQKRAFDYNGVPFGYGNSEYNNTGCNIETSTACVGNTKQIWQASLGMWWKFYQGKFGKAQVGAQYSYTQRKAFDGQGVAPKANENMFFTSLRYYPF